MTDILKSSHFSFLIIFLLFYNPVPSLTYSISPFNPPGSMNRLMTQHVTVQCDFSRGNSGEVCTATNLNITSRNVTVIRISTDYNYGITNGQVTNFIVSRQNFIFIPEGLSNFFRNLETWTIFESKLRALRFTDFIGFSRLQRIFIQGNHIQSIDEDTFKSLPLLEVLDLSSNRITSIPFKAFSTAAELKIFTLSNNLIRIFDILPFPVNSRLEELRLNGNQLVRINLAAIMNTRRLKTLDLHDNFCINLAYPMDIRNVVQLYTEIVTYCNNDKGVLEDGSTMSYSY